MKNPTPKLKQPNYWQPNPKQDKKAMWIFFIVFIALAIYWWYSN